VLVERATRLCQADPAAQLIVVTFTRQAAAELRRRLEEKLANLANVRVATFHSLALQQMLINNRVRICSPTEQLALLQLAAQAHLAEKDFPAFRSAADAYTSGQPSALDRADFQLTYDAYLELLAGHSAIDFGQGVLSAVEGMESGEIRPYPCDYLLVDEVQDIDPTQVRWVMAHTAAGATLTIVGDDDQSIFGFRSAMGIRGMTFIQDRHSAERIELTINYRSHLEILSLAVRLINHNLKRVPKQLASAKGAGGAVRLHSRYWSDEDEDEAIATHLQRTPGEWAVIARTNRKLDRIAHALRSLGIRFSRPGRTPFWESEEPALFLRLLSPAPLSDPLTRAALQARTRAGSDPQRGSRDPIHELSEALKSCSRALAPAVRINAVAAWLQTHVQGLPKNRIAGARQLIEHCKGYLSSMEGSLESRLAQARRPRSTKEEDIRLISMHGAKGLEFDNVWIAGCQDGVIPNSRSQDLEEERRLMYVAMTRAERHLHLSFAWNQQVTPFERTPYLKRLAPSRFLTMDLKLPIPPRESVTPRAA